MLMIKLVLIYFLQNVFTTEAARVFAYYPTPSISHQSVFRPITLELIKLGHHVTVITPNPMFSKDTRPANLTEIDTQDISYNAIKHIFSKIVTGKKDDFISQAKIINVLFTHLIEEQFKLQEVQALLQNKNDHFDLILLEAYLSIGLGWTHKFSAPTILVSSFGAYPGNYETVGAPTHPIIYQDIFRQKIYNLTLWDKIIEMLNHFRVRSIISSGEENENKILQKLFGENIPPINILKNNVDMLFLNINPIWEGNYPVPPNVIYMGGLHMNPPKKLPNVNQAKQTIKAYVMAANLCRPWTLTSKEVANILSNFIIDKVFKGKRDLQNYLDTSKNGVIYFSFGTNVKPSLLPPEKIAIFENVFSQLPYNVIWKWDTKSFTSKSSNIKIFDWLPQPDLLRHPNVKLFITQGGLQSTDEAITAGVPLIGVPMMGDQWFNVEKFVHHKIGVRLDFEDLTKDKLQSAIKEVIDDKSYRNNIIRLRSLMQDQPQTPQERAIWWIEYVLRHGGAKHFRAPAANISWSEFLELELISVIILTAFVLLAFIVTVTKFLYNKLKRYQSISKMKKS